MNFVDLKELTTYLDELLGLDAVPGDPSNNGLQVEGRSEVRKAVFGVDACLELFEGAVEKNADFIFVHHGLSWGDSLKRLVGINASRLRPLFKNDISLYAAHIPLDMHPQVGHNALLADMIGLKKRSMFCEYAGVEFGVVGELENNSTPKDIAEIFDRELGSEHILYGARDRTVGKVAVASGGAGYEAVIEALRLGADLCVTGEVGHSAFHIIKETGMTVLALGHYCSEKPGEFAVMEKVKNDFNIECEFIDLPTGL